MTTSKRSSKDQRANLHASEEKYRTIVESAGEGILVMQGGKRVYYNPRWLEITGYSAKEYEKIRFLSLVQAEDVDVVTSAYETLISGEEFELDLEFRLVTSSGEIKYLKGKASRIDWDGEPAAMILTNDITERKHVEEKIKESQERFDLAMQASRDGLFDWDLETNKIYYSPGWKSMLGYEYDEIPNDFSIWETNTHPEDVKRSWQMQQEVIDKKRDRFEMEFKMKHKDGHWVDILSRADAVFNENGKAVRMIGTHVDITERKEAEIALLDSEEKYKALYEKAPLSYQSLNEDGSFGDINPTWLSTLGYTQEEVLGHFFVDFLHPDWQPRFKKYFPEFKRRGYVSNVEYKIRHKDGHYLDISFEGCIGYNPDGSFRQTYCVFKDITEQKKAEDAVIESEEKFRLLHENAGLGIGYYSVDGVVISFNTIAAKDMNGVPEDFAGKSIFDLFPKESADFYFERLEKAINTNEIKVYEDHVQLPNQEKWFLSTYTKIVNSEDEILGIQIISQNITEQKEADEALRQSTHLLEESQSIARVGGWELDIASGDLFWTAETYRIHDTSPEEFNPTVDAGVGYFLPESRRIISEALDRAIEHGEGYDLYLDTWTTKGRLIHVRTTCEVTLDDGHPVKLTGIFQDITDQKEAEKKLSESLADLELAQAIASIGNWLFDPEVGVPVWSEEIYNIYERDKKLGPPHIDEYKKMYSEEQYNIFTDAFGAAMNDGTPYDIVLKFISPNDKEKWIRAICKPDIAEKGAKGYFLRGTIQDITEHKQAEISLRNSEEKHKRYVENAPVGVFIVDSAGKYIVVNSVACELLGYTQSELLELSIPDVSIRKEAGDTFQNLKESGKLGYEGLLKKKDGSIVQVRLDAVSLPNNQFIAFCTDITERKRGEEELEKHRNHLEELVGERTEELKAKMEEHVDLFDMMIGREVRMAELKKVIKRLREQLKDNEIIPIANDPLLGDDAD